MTAGDMEKTAFVTNDGIFCYTQMPFRLKNVGAEFQQMVNKLFGEEINRNMEVYIDEKNENGALMERSLPFILV